MAPPIVQNENPAAGSVYFDVAQNLYLEVVDADGNLDASTVKITLTGVVVWESDAQQNGYTVTKTAITNGFSYEINPPSDLEARTHTVEVYAQDLIPETLDTSWTFTAGDYQIGVDNQRAKNFRTELGISDDERTGGGNIVDMLVPTIGTGRWLPGVGGPIDMPGAPAKPSAAITFGSYGRGGPDSTIGFSDLELYGFHIGAGGPADFFLSILPDKPSALNRGGGISTSGPLLARTENFLDDYSGEWADQAGVDDNVEFPQASGGRAFHSFPPDCRGRTLFDRDVVDGRDPPQTEAEAVDGFSYILGAPHDYMLDVADGDGNDLGSGYEIEQIEAFASIDQQPWDVDADSAGFYGYAKDGACRYNGQTTQPGVFASGAGAFNRRSWGDGQGLLAFGNIDGDAAAIGADTIRLSNTFDAWAADFIDSAARWYFNGDFDITLDFANFSSSGGTDGGFSLEAWADEGNGLYLRRNGPLGRYDRDVMSGGSWLSGANAATSDTSGTLRISRSGATVRTFYWTGSWTELGTGYAMARTDPMWIKIKLSGTGTVTLSADASNFQILSGTWTNKASWAEEGFSTTRGNAVAFPNSLLVLASWGGVDLIDTDNDLLWMHFDVGTGDMLHNDVYKARDAAFEDGILLLAGSAEANNEGSLTVIDFNLDAARIPRYEESSITGGYFDAVSGQSSDSGRARTIANRNGGAGYSQDFNRWSVGSGATKNPHNAVALALSSGKVYAVGGGNESLTVFRWDRWDVLDTWRDNVDAAYWNVSGEQVYWTWFRPQDNTLFWTADDAGDTVLYSQALASIELPMHGGNFTASTSKVLPGDRLLAADMLSHHRPVINGATVYAVALNEVWTMTWPGGSWSRWLGLPGSGATYETLPTNLFRLTAIRHVKDATLDLLAVSLDTGIRSQVLLFRMDTGALHAKTRLDGARVLTSLAAAI